jgi:hypothetical protein
MIGWAVIKPLLPHIAIAAALGFAVWYLDHKGYQRAKEDAERAKMENALIVADIVMQSERRMAGKVNAAATVTTDAIAAINATNQTIIQPTLVKELQRETRFTDPATGISIGLRDAINAARALSGASTPASELNVSLPAPIPTD